MKIKHLLVSTFLLMAGMSQGQYIYTFNNGNANNESTVSSTSGFNGTLVGTGAALMADRFGNPNQAYNLNGTGSINLGNNPFMTGKGSFSLTMWAQKPLINGSFGFLTKGGGYTRISSNNLGGLDAVLVPGATTEIEPTAYSTITGGSWFHLAYVKDGTTLNLYVNGVLYAQNTSVAALSRNFVDDLFIGDGCSNCSIKIPNIGVDDIYIFDYALNASQVENNKNIPVIITQPKPACNAPADLNVSASGTNLTYLWSNGAITSTTTAATVGEFSVTITSAFNTVVSRTIYVGNVPVPEIITQVESFTACAGSSLTKTFAISSTGSNLTYLWNTGETTRTISKTIERDIITVSGSYNVTVTGTCGFVVSNSALFSTVDCNQYVYSFNTGTMQNDVMPGTLNGINQSSNTFANDRFNNPGQAIKLGEASRIGGSINLGNNPSLNGDRYTITMWAQKNATNLDRVLFDKGDAMRLRQFGNTLVAYSSCQLGDRNTSFSPTSTVFSDLAENEWFHVAYVRQAFTISLYVNGELYSSFIGANNNICTGNNNFTISPMQTYNQFSFWGKGVDDIYIYNYSLTDAEIIANKNLPFITQPQSACTVPANLNVSASGTNLTYLWSNGATTSTTTATSVGSYTVTVTGSFGNAISNTVQVGNIADPIIVSQPQNYSNCSIAGISVSVSATGSNLSYLWSSGETTNVITKSVAGSYQVTVTGLCSSVISNSAVLSTADCSQFIYSFNNGNANNDVANVLNGTVTGGATLMTDRNGDANKAYNLNSTGSINLGDNPLLKNKGSFTLTMWVQKPAINEIKGLVYNGGTQIRTYSDGVLYAYTHATEYTTPIAPTVYSTITGGSWFHLAYVKSGTTLNLYVNGVLYAQNNSVRALSDATEDLKIGWTNFETSIPNGGVDDIYIYNNALSPAEVVDNKNNIISSTQNPKQIETATTLTIYPNPSTGAFTVENGESITVYDMLGKVILSTSETTFTIASKGIFVAKVKTANGVKFVKLVVE
ncbi:MAG: T9SS C-terminal target domain-containing protein [Cytophagales bacterium]|nr:MAG: T9SS C-terminal target domain-containing protein [Cytophagales bacterium]